MQLCNVNNLELRKPRNAKNRIIACCRVLGLITPDDTLTFSSSEHIFQLLLFLFFIRCSELVHGDCTIFMQLKIRIWKMCAMLRCNKSVSGLRFELKLIIYSAFLTLDLLAPCNLTSLSWRAPERSHSKGHSLITYPFSPPTGGGETLQRLSTGRTGPGITTPAGRLWKLYFFPSLSCHVHWHLDLILQRRTQQQTVSIMTIT